LLPASFAAADGLIDVVPPAGVTPLDEDLAGGAEGDRESRD
jgi:hypothetical protein